MSTIFSRPQCVHISVTALWDIFLMHCWICEMGLLQMLVSQLIRKSQDHVYGIRKYNMFNTLRPKLNGCHFTENIFKCIFLNKTIWITIKISLQFVHLGPINYIPSLVQIMVWHRPDDKPLSESMLVRLSRHIHASLGLNEINNLKALGSKYLGRNTHQQILLDICRLTKKNCSPLCQPCSASIT